MTSKASTTRAKLAQALLSPWVYRVVRLVLGAVFVAAGALKLADPHGFAEIIARYQLVPHGLVPLTALGLPALEVAAGLGLILDLRLCLSAVTAMLVMFAGVLYYGALQGLDVDCGCFSAREQAEHDSLRAALYRDLIMLGGAAYAYFWRLRKREAIEQSSWRYSWHLKKEEYL